MPRAAAVRRATGRQRRAPDEADPQSADLDDLPVGQAQAGAGDSGQSAATSTLPGIAQVGAVIAANMSVYCSRTASSTTAAAAGSDAHLAVA